MYTLDVLILEIVGSFFLVPFSKDEEYSENDIYICTSTNSNRGPKVVAFPMAIPNASKNAISDYKNDK
jgi:hypothetical protein